MKKAIPVIIAIILIIIIFAASFGKSLYDKYSYGHDYADLNDYFEIFTANDVPIILQNEKISKSGKLFESVCYFDLDTIEDLFTIRFYIDENEGLLLYSTPTTTFENVIGTKTVTDVKTGSSENLDYVPARQEGEQFYIAADYVKRFVNFSYELFKDPNRMQVYTEWGTRKIATVKSDTEVRKLGGVKSLILTDISAGTDVEILEPMDDWTKVKTDDCFIGYIENFRLKDERSDTLTPVTDVPAETPVFLTRDHKINLTWHNIEFAMGGSELRTAVANTKALNVISPTWYWLTDNEGSFTHVANVAYTEAAHELGLEVWALISDFHSGVDVDTYEVLGYTSKRRQLVSNLVSSVLEYGADGINVDFEQIKSKCAHHYVQFIREQAIECHANGLVLSVDNFVPTEYTAYYNRRAQGEFADYIIIMGYDEHYKGSPEAGSVSSVPWMQKGIEDTLKYVPKERVINAVPFYTRVWMTEGEELKSEAVTMETSQDFLTRNGLTATWNEATYQNYAEATLGNVFYQVWMEDKDSMQVRLNVMKQTEIAGVASWKLGQETPDIWDLMELYMSE